VPAQLGRTNRPTQKEARAAPRHVAMSWAQRLKRVFDIDIETCEYCGGALKIIASIENPQLIGKILEHLERTGATHSPPPARHRQSQRQNCSNNLISSMDALRVEQPGRIRCAPRPHARCTQHPHGAAPAHTSITHLATPFGSLVPQR